MEIKDILLILLPIISGLIGSYCTYYFTLRAKRISEILKYKEEKYANLTVLLQGFVGNTTSLDLKRKFFEEQYRSWLYASDDVIRSINRMIALIIEHKGQDVPKVLGKKTVGEVILSMRKDLIGKTSVAPEEFYYTSVIKD
ncbi:conserved hypothetical protein [Leptospira interrogans serovar Manilae]|uniref:Uncharacterized protein n=1 Tax=Leptospira interrogans serovar Manilae TaxID=214675 RepID=A0AAQ1NXZ6_LEPIR|nr:hypothetical protein [Leptospira interrogans]AKP28216.1 hypothetical protein LIMLP_19380 [Leptospira interrogans serovar Manilae]AKP31998.1 hypothetical protein LIMHP_19385 [Leptospira interrogans serovar Manilae]EYU64952.1 hypothetical protein CI00_00340 [Leptospira interrogans serovar Manilae]SOR60641.1 conserved hypothetical protein [Leptospira interrogans serovar Manilae]